MNVELRDGVQSPTPSMKCSFMREGLRLPVLAEPAGTLELADLLSTVGAHGAWVNRTLLEYGALLFRGFPLSTPEEFEAFVKAVDPELRSYTEGQSQRSRIHGQIYTSTEYPPEHDITLHNELSYTSSPPRRLCFFCQIPPEKGGETPIADCRRVYDTLDRGIRDVFVERKIQYVKNMHGGKGFGKSWQEHFETSEREEVESYLRQGSVEFSWKPDGTLWTRQVRPAAIQHPESGETVWFNQADLWHYSNLGEKGEALRRLLGEENLPTNACFGDGSRMDPDHLEAIRRLFWQEAVLFPWQKGDVLVIDNRLVAHGRKAFKGARRILVAMT